MHRVSVHVYVYTVYVCHLQIYTHVEGENLYEGFSLILVVNASGYPIQLLFSQPLRIALWTLKTS